MKFTRHTLKEIRERTDFVELVNGYTRLEQRSGRWWGLSPFKAEKTPSFSVKPEEGFYYCFATQKGGDIFRFVSEVEGLSFPEAVRFLADRAGIALVEESADPDRQDRQVLYELYVRVAGTFAWFLRDPRGNQALEYLRNRGIEDSAIDAYQLGFAPDSASWLYRFLRSKSYSASFLAKSGLFSRRKPDYPLFRNRIMFPIADERRRVVAFGGRALSSEERAKYMNSPDTLIYNKKRILYGLPQAMEKIRTDRKVFVAEGYLDVIALYQGGFENAVAPLGTALTGEQVNLLKRWVDDVVLVFDADSAGLAATFRAALTVEEANLGCYVLPMSAGTDPADLYLAEGTEGFRRVSETIRPAFDYLLETAAAETDLRDSRGRELLLRKLFPYIKVVRSEVRREALLEQVGDAMQVPVAAVRSDLRRWVGQDYSTPAAGEKKDKTERKHNRDFALMLACIQRSEFFVYLRNVISHDDLDDREAKRLFLHAEDAYRHGEEFPRGVLDRLQDESVRNEVLQRLTSGEYAGWRSEDIEAASRHMRIRKLEETQHVVEVQLKTTKPDDNQKMRQLLEQKMAIDQELLQLKARVDD